jgi:cystathionine gamma-synthase
MESKADGGVEIRDEYSRYSNPTVKTAERRLALLEGGENALLFSSGMAAITTTLSTLLSKGDHLLLIAGCYRRTLDFTVEFLSRWGINTTVVPIDSPETWERSIRRETRMLFAETPTNPYLRVINLLDLVKFSRSRGIITVIDSTFATPINLKPLEFGIDLVIHSASKYLGGHNDLLAGVVIGSGQVIADIHAARGVLGGVSNPNDAYLLIRGLKSLVLRVQHQNNSGEKIARFLDNHPKINQVYYPGLINHPDHKIANIQMTGFGGVVSFEIKGGFNETGHFIDRLKIPYIGPTLGGVESIVQQPAAFYSLDSNERMKSGISDNLVRYSIGIEDVSDLIEDLDQALAGVGVSP